VRASPKSHIFRSQFALTRRFPGFRSLWSIPAEWRYFRPRSNWKRKYWQWSLESGWDDLIIWCRSVSMSSETKYTSLKLLLCTGIIISFRAITFSCLKCRRSISSRSVLSASTRLSKTLFIFFYRNFLIGLAIYRRADYSISSSAYGLDWHVLGVNLK